MVKRIVRATALVAFISLSSCNSTSENPEINGFNAYQWQRDKYGCSGIRSKMVSPLLEGQEKVYGYREQNVISFLGKPDGQELYRRGQKFLIYFTEPNSNCQGQEGEDTKIEKGTLYIRLDALGKVNELFVE